MNKFYKISYLQFMRDLEESGDYITTGFDEVWDDALHDYQSIENVYDSIELPERQTAYSAGYDFVTPIGITIPAGEQVDILTGVKVRLDDNCVLLIDVRSSIGIKRGLSLANTIGVIDADYHNNFDNEGHIHICLRNNGDSPIVLEAGERIAQGIIVRYEVTDDDAAAGERTGGIGSTGNV